MRSATAKARAGRDAEMRRDVAEQIARKIEDEMEYEGVRAQRVMKMCAHIARTEGERHVTD